MMKKFPVAVISFILGILSFVQLFGLEKAAFAVILGGIALKSVPEGMEKGKTFAYIGIVLGSLYIITILAILIIKGPTLVDLIGKMK